MELRGYSGPIDVTVASKSRSPCGIRRRCSSLPPDEIGESEDFPGIPVTSVPRTILDNAASGDADLVESMLRQVERRRLFDCLSLSDLLARYPHRRGCRAVRTALKRIEEAPGHTESPLEGVFLRFLRAHGLPIPRLNEPIVLGDRRYRVDCRWPGTREIVELDGWETHGTRAAFRDDRERDRRLRAHPHRLGPAQGRTGAAGRGPQEPSRSPVTGGRFPSKHTNVCDNVRGTMSAVTPTSHTEHQPSADPSPSVGLRIRALREAMGLSLRDLAQRSGVSAPMLSQVERGETSPTLASAAKVAAGLELTLSQLLRLDEGQNVHVNRAGERRRSERGGHRIEELTPPLPGQRADVSLHRLAPGATTGGRADPPMHEPGSRETAVVLGGALALIVDGARHELHEGDAVTFDADLPHHFENEGEEPTRFLAVITAGLRRS
jgi:transcriptional regulator with XRE-family HTH domain